MIGNRQPGSSRKPRSIHHDLAILVVASLGLIATDARAQNSFGESAGTMTFFAPTFAPTFASPAETSEAPRRRVYIWSHSHHGGTRNSFCVRTCDGRFFPVPKMSGVNDVESCQAVCPSAEMQVYSGADIDNATTERGNAYKTLVNAFRFRREMVPSCTCNERTVVGLTRVSIENDSTIRSGDIVAEEHGFSVASQGGSGRRRMMFRPLSQAKARALGLTRISTR